MSDRAGVLALLRRASRHRGAAVGMAILFLLSVAALLAPVIAPRDPLAQSLDDGLSPPSTTHWLGQDKLGRDVLSRLLHGARLSLAVGFLTVAISLSIGVAAGSLAGFLGGTADRIFVHACDVLMAFPGILLAIGISAVRGPSFGNVLFALSVLGWVGYARVVRTQVLKLKTMDYVEAARAVGGRRSRLLLAHVLPNALSPILVEATFGIGRAIVAEAGLSFLGLGVAPPAPSWGSMIGEGRHFLFVAPHLVTAPGAAILLTVMSFNFVGDGLRDALDVRHRPFDTQSYP
jgi:ABC-type dipeptide/oligopeptide/nickel transport system permease subunit